MSFKKYVFLPYSKEFPKLFKIEKARLMKILPKDSVIEHIGSTAVPNLDGKGIIDVIVSVEKSQIGKSKRKLERAGFIFKPHAGCRQRMFFQKDYVYSGKTRRVHVHLTFHNSLVFLEAVALVKFLKANPKIAERYAVLKKKAVRIAKEDGKKYHKLKAKFLDAFSEKALREFG